MKIPIRNRPEYALVIPREHLEHILEILSANHTVRSMGLYIDTKYSDPDSDIDEIEMNFPLFLNPNYDDIDIV